MRYVIFALTILLSAATSLYAQRLVSCPIFELPSDLIGNGWVGIGTGFVDPEDTWVCDLSDSSGELGIVRLSTYISFSLVTERNDSVIGTYDVNEESPNYYSNFSEVLTIQPAVFWIMTYHDRYQTQFVHPVIERDGKLYVYNLFEPIGWLQLKDGGADLTMEDLDIDSARNYYLIDELIVKVTQPTNSDI